MTEKENIAMNHQAAVRLQEEPKLSWSIRITLGSRFQVDIVIEVQQFLKSTVGIILAIIVQAAFGNQLKMEMEPGTLVHHLARASIFLASVKMQTGKCT